MTIRGEGPRRIVLTVTSSKSLMLLTGFPEHLRTWEIHVVADAPSADLSKDVTFHRLPMVQNPAPWRDLQALFQWVRLLRQIRPEVVMAGTPKAGLLGMLAAWWCRVPTRIYHLRGLRLETMSGPGRRILWVLERLTAAASTVVLSVSHSLSREYVRERLSPAKKVVVLGSGSSNGVDLDRFARVDPSLVARLKVEHDVGDMTVGFVGRITSDKGVPTLLAAVDSLRNSGLPVRLLALGEVPDSSLLAGVDVNAVLLTGFVEEPAPYFKLMDVLCLPTRREGFPNVVIQAAASGVPTVASNATGCEDAVVDGESGLIFPVDDSAALAACLRALLTDKERCRAMGAAARRRAEREFDRRDVWRRTAEFVEQQSNQRRRDVVSG